MDITLTRELEEYVQHQVELGFYPSASEVICDALRSQMMASSIDQIDERIALGRKQITEGNFAVADDAFFDRAREYVKKKYMSGGD